MKKFGGRCIQSSHLKLESRLIVDGTFFLFHSSHIHRRVGVHMILCSLYVMRAADPLCVCIPFGLRPYVSPAGRRTFYVIAIFSSATPEKRENSRYQINSPYCKNTLQIRFFCTRTVLDASETRSFRILFFAQR